ncbi:MAG TPA: glycosyltransferase family 2 protein [Anaeromyxobacteraceae bacterium]|nr:glycosyltransferase family 2 protein [Anaeromyxobacteraceae bacterium]
MTDAAAAGAGAPGAGEVAAGGIDGVSIVMPVFNQLAYTKLCLESLTRHPEGIGEIVVIDNGSSDGSGDWLQGAPGIRLIRNAENRGCAGGWNQGVAAARGEWIVVLNNDVLVTAGWIQGMLDAARELALDVVTPAIREGEADYDLDGWARAVTAKLGRFCRLGAADGICFMVRRRVFETVGTFDEHFRIGQFEDSDFFRRARLAGFRLGVTGRAFLHHFGSVTQKAVRKAPSGGSAYMAENRAYYRKKWRLTWLRRQPEKWSSRARHLAWRWRERLATGRTLKETWVEGRPRFK